eukprot:g16547.t1
MKGILRTARMSRKQVITWPVLLFCLVPGPSFLSLHRPRCAIRTALQAEDLTRSKQREGGPISKSLINRSRRTSVQQALLQEEGRPIEIKGYLQEALLKANLLDRADDIQDWCEEQGAELLQEVLDELNTLGEDLELENDVLSRLGDALLQTQQSAREEMEERERATREGMASLGHRLMNGQISLEAVQEAYGSIEQKT